MLLRRCLFQQISLLNSCASRGIQEGPGNVMRISSGANVSPGRKTATDAFLYKIFIS